MKIKLVPRSDVKTSRKKKSKYQSLKDALEKLEPGGKAIQVKFSNRKELISYRNIIYSFNRENKSSVRSSADSNNDTLYLYID